MRFRAVERGSQTSTTGCYVSHPDHLAVVDERDAEEGLHTLFAQDRAPECGVGGRSGERVRLAFGCDLAGEAFTEAEGKAELVLAPEPCRRSHPEEIAFAQEDGSGVDRAGGLEGDLKQLLEEGGH